MEVLKKFGQLIKERRYEVGLSQEKLAELCGLSPRQIVKIEKGIVSVRLINLVRICVECKIDIGELEQFWVSPYEDLNIGLCEIPHRK